MNIRLYPHLSTVYIPDDIEKVVDVTAEVPLSLDCNKERFPYWFGLSDPRNKILHNKLVGFKKSVGITGNKLCPFLFSRAYISLSNTSYGTVLTCDKEGGIFKSGDKIFSSGDQI